MKFSTLKEFWEWLTISTGNFRDDYQSIIQYIESGDAELLSSRQRFVLFDYISILRKLALEEQELKL
jgi:hypothetical protein